MSGLKRIGKNAPTVLITLVLQKIIGMNKSSEKKIYNHFNGPINIHSGKGNQDVKGQISTSILSNLFSLLINTENKRPTKLGVGAALTFAGYVAYKTINRKTHEKGEDTPKL